MTFFDKTSPPAEKKENPIYQAIDISFIIKIIMQFQYKLWNQDKDKYNHRDHFTEHDQKSQQGDCFESALCNCPCQVKDRTNKSQQDDCIESALCNRPCQVKVETNPKHVHKKTMMKHNKVIAAGYYCTISSITSAFIMSIQEIFRNLLHNPYL